MLELSKAERDFLFEEISRELGAKRDGSGKNLIATCPHCGKAGKFGVYIGKDTERKKLFMSNCFSCGGATKTLDQLLSLLGRPDLMVTQTADLSGKLDIGLFVLGDQVEEVDDSLVVVELPDFYRRCFRHPYLGSRGFTCDDYEFFPVGTTRGLNFRFDEYVIFPVTDQGDVVGYVARHTWGKQEIDVFNRRAKMAGGYRILRFRNSTENEFVKLLYNYDAIVEDVTDTVILVEGIFDVVALTRKLELYESERMVAVATFGKKISQVQIYKLQVKGVRTVVIGYDGDAVEAIKKIAMELSAYFEVLVADIPDASKDWEELSEREIYKVFAYGLKTPVEYKIGKLQEL